MSELKQVDKQRGVVSLDSIVRSALMDIGESLSRYEQFRHWCIEGYRDFRFDLANEIKTAKLELTSWKSIQLPIDYIDWVMIGVIDSQNKIQVFTHDDRIPIHHEDEDGYPEDIASLETLPEPSVPDNVAETLSFWNNGEVGQLYGLVAKSNGVGYYKFNPQRREIQFAPSIKSGTTVYLEYITDGFDPCEKTMVNLYAAKLLKLYIHWQRHEFAKSSAMWEKERAKDNYWKEYYRVQNRLNPITVEEVLESAREGYKLTPWM